MSIIHLYPKTDRKTIRLKVTSHLSLIVVCTPQCCGEGALSTRLNRKHLICGRRMRSWAYIQTRSLFKSVPWNRMVQIEDLFHHHHNIGLPVDLQLTRLEAASRGLYQILFVNVLCFTYRSEVSIWELSRLLGFKCMLLTTVTFILCWERSL